MLAKRCEKNRYQPANPILPSEGPLSVLPTSSYLSVLLETNEALACRQTLPLYDKGEDFAIKADKTTKM